MAEDVQYPTPTWIALPPQRENLPNWVNDIRRAFLMDWNALQRYILAVANRTTGILAGMGASLAVLTVTIASGTFQVLGTQSSYAGGTIALDAADPDPRFDVVYIDAGGTLHFQKGTAAVHPVIPVINYQTNAQLAVVYVSGAGSWIAG